MKTSCVTSSASSRSPVRTNAQRKTRAWYADTSVLNAASSPSRVRAMSSSGSTIGIGRPVIGEMSPRNGCAFTQTGARYRRLAPGSQFWKSDADLALVFAALVFVGDLGFFFAAEEKDLRDAFVRIDLRGQRRGVRDLERHVAFPLRLERRDVGDDPAARVRRFADGDR